MKELSGSADVAVSATPDEAFALLAAVDRYPSWLEDNVREVEVLATGADGRATQVRTVLHVVAGPIAKDFHLVMDVSYSEGEEVDLSRVPHAGSEDDRFEVVWRVEAGPPTRIAIELTATLEVPRLVPLGGVGDRLAQGFVEAAKRELEGASPNASASSS
jgi:hypothetical protein